MPLAVLIAHRDDRSGHDEPGDRDVATLVPDLGLAGPVVIDAPDREAHFARSRQGWRASHARPRSTPVDRDRAARPG